MIKLYNQVYNRNHLKNIADLYNQRFILIPCESCSGNACISVNSVQHDFSTNLWFWHRCFRNGVDVEF